MRIPDVNFVIPHKGREEFLAATLASIAQLKTNLAIDIVVVTQNESLATSMQTPRPELSFRVMYASPSLTIAALRNLGVSDASAQYLAFIDADIGLSPDWLDVLLAILQHEPNVAIVSAKQRCNTDAPVLERIRTSLSNAAIDSEVDFLPGRNLLMRRATFDSVGGFPENLVTCEDYYFTDRARQFGSLWYSGVTSYVHLGEDRVYSEMFKKEIWRGQSNLQSLSGRTPKMSEWPSILMPIWITLMTALTFISLALGATTSGTLAAIAALMPFTAYVTRLRLLTSGSISLFSIIKFYLYYFPARAWGTFKGLRAAIESETHRA